MRDSCFMKHSARGSRGPTGRQREAPPMRHGEGAGLRMEVGGRDQCSGWSEAPACDDSEAMPVPCSCVKREPATLPPFCP